MAISRRTKRYYRTLFLGLTALGFMVWFAVDQFDIPWGEMRELISLTVLAAVVVIVGAALFVAVWLGLRKLLQAQRQDH